jgi:membrane protein YqaA with SNARE-associated domain
MEATLHSVPKVGFIRNLYNKAMESADSPKAFRIFCGISFAESSFFPLPPDLLMIPMILANKSLAWRLAFWGTITSVLGGLFGYAIGYFLFEAIGTWIIETYHLQNAMTAFQNGYNEWGFWIIILKGVTPIPYKLVTISSGLARYDLPLFILASIIARGFRFYVLAAILFYFGPTARVFIEKYLTLCLTASLIIIVMGFVIVKYVTG